MTWAPLEFTGSPRAWESSWILARFRLALPFVPTWKSGCAVQGQSEIRACKGMAINMEVNFSYRRNQVQKNLSEG